MPGILHGALISSYGAAPKVLTYQGSAQFAGGATQTYTSAPIGTAASDRYVIVAIAGEDNANTTITSVTCAGNAMTPVVTSNSTRSSVGIYILLVTSGTTANIAVTFSASKDASFIGVWSATGLSSATAVGTNTQTSNNTSTSLTAVAGGFAVGVAGNYGSGATCAWTGLTEKFDLTQSSTRNGTGASDATTGSSINVTANYTSAGTAYTMALASW